MSKTHEANIDGKKMVFYPLPVSVLFECNRLGGSIASLTANLFADTSSDVEVEETTVPQVVGTGEDNIYHTMNKVSKALSPSMASLRIGQKRDGVQALFDSLTDKDAQMFLALIVTKSLKDEDLDPATLLDEVSIEVFVDMMKGVKEANKGVFDKLGKWSRLLVPQQAAAAIREKLASAMGSES